MDIKAIQDTLAPALDERGLFLVEVKISKDNDITVTVESYEGTVTLDDCELLNRLFTSTFDQDVEDYSLTMSSAGLDGEFKHPAQFRKAVGQKVELWLKGGRKLTGTLRAYNDEDVDVDGTVYKANEINKVKYHIEF